MPVTEANTDSCSTSVDPATCRAAPPGASSAHATESTCSLQLPRHPFDGWNGLSSVDEVLADTADCWPFMRLVNQGSRGTGVAVRIVCAAPKRSVPAVA